MLKKVDHIGIAVHDLEETAKFYRDVLGMELQGVEEVATQKVKVAFFKIGETNIELVMPTSEDSPVAKYLQKKGEGIHHICYATDDIEKEIENVKAKGGRMIDETPRPGAHGARVAFIHPKSSKGVLTELSQKG
ncbi:MAG: methylmalonyl-CoA epimerase [Desulfobacca sp. 4484_104]|nr:MAG: methylmalonyl-CoA epimerase [Desulfobacca sp. 4484_104]RLB71782.1 MAG: methylmalonyl-CoA epimerase [Deltaproteobacteria bacterium]